MLAMLIGCGRGDDGPPTGPQTIGPAGGSVESDDGVLKLDIPAGALAEEAVFEITLVPQTEWPLPTEIVVGNVYDIQPEGTLFAVPATLTWAYATAPAGVETSEGRSFVFGTSASETGVIETSRRTTAELRLDGSLIASNDIPHLSLQMLTHGVREQAPELTEFGLVDARLNGGEHFVDLPWSGSILFTYFGGLDTVVIEAELGGDAPVAPINDPPSWDDTLLFGEIGYTAQVSVRDFSPPPRWRCTAPGAGKVKLTYTGITLEDGSATPIVAAIRFEEDVTCVEREEKPEFQQHSASLGANRIETLVVPNSDQQDLAAVQGAYGYLIAFDAGKTVEVCVLSNGSTAVLYLPHFSPGFDFLDTAPGCTQLTNKDPDNTNDVLVELTGTGVVTITTAPVP
jgi:hypothetical protein